MIESQWAQTLSNRKLLCHCWNYPRIHKQSFRATADYVDALLSSGGSGWRKFSFPSLSLSPPPSMPLLQVPHLLPMKKTDVTSPLKGTPKCTKCFFHPLLLSMRTLVFSGWGGAELTFPLLTPRLRNVCQTSLIHSSDNRARVHSDELTVVKAG